MSNATQPGSIQPGEGFWSTNTAFVAAQGLGAAGAVVGMLGATSITAATRGGAHGAIWTGAFLVLLFISKAIAVRFVPRWSARFGAKQSFGTAVLMAIILWSGAGLLVSLGAPGTVVVFAISPLAGIVNAAFAVESPLLAKAFLSKHSMAAANARVSVVCGIACAVGSISAGLLINFAGAGWALFGRALLTVPMLILIRRSTSTPEVTPGTLETADQPLADDVPTQRWNPALRRILVLGIAMTVSTAPLFAMIVPIAQSLRQTPLVIGASIMLAAISAGGLLAPLFVNRFERRGAYGRDPLSAVLMVTGLSILAFGVASLLLTSRAELIAWVVVGLIFGGAESASHSTILGQVIVAARGADPRQSIATLKFTMATVAPIGFVAWALLLDLTSGVVAILSAAGLLLMTTLALWKNPEDARLLTR